MAAPIASRSGGVRPAREKFAMPKTRSSRSRTTGHAAAGPSTSSMRPISDRTSRTSRSAVRRAQVADEPVDEPRPVPPLERDFLVVDDDGLHRASLSARASRLQDLRAVTNCRRPATSRARRVRGAVPADDRALDRSGQAGVDPVAREPEARDRRPVPGGPAGRARARTWRCLSRTTVAWTSGRRAAAGSASRTSAIATLDEIRRWSAPRSPRRRSTRATGATPRPPNAWRLSNTHCIVRPGRPTNGTSITGRSSQRFTVTIGDDGRVADARSTTRRHRRPALGLRASAQRVPGHGADDRRPPPASLAAPLDVRDPIAVAARSARARSTARRRRVLRATRAPARA